MFEKIAVHIYEIMSKWKLMTSNKKNILLKRKTISFNMAAVITAIISAIITLLMFFISYNFGGIFNSIFNDGNLKIFILNFLPIILASFTLLFLTNNFIITNGLVLFVVILLTYTSRAKIFFRASPLHYYDFTLIGEFIGIAKSFTVWYFVSKIMIIVIVILFIFALSYFIKTEKIIVKWKLIGATTTFLLLFVLYNDVIKIQPIYNSFPVQGDVYSEVDQYNSRGFMYSFLNDMANARAAKKMSIQVDENELNANIEIGEQIANEIEKKPQIIMIQSEAYSDIGINRHIDFSNFEDPYKNFKEISQNSFYRKMVVANVGGGTADTEFDILTAMNTRYFRSVPYTFKVVEGKVDAIPSMLEKIGYKNIAIHPGDPNYYDRKTVYEYFGFDEFLTISSFDQEDLKGSFISEEQTFNKIISEYEKHMEENGEYPYLSWTITIQNHGPFMYKYGADTNFDTDLTLSSDDENALSNYFVGVNDVDIELKKLTDYFENKDEPVILVYWGDHQPALSPVIYDKLLRLDHKTNDLDTMTCLNQVPFFVWENKSSKDSFDVVSILEEKYPDKNFVMSDFYLTPILFDAIGFKGVSYYMDYPLTILKEYPVLMEDYYFDKNGNSKKYLGDFSVEYFKNLGYYRIKEALIYSKEK